MIETERLLLHPLTPDQLEKYLKMDFSLEAELHLEEHDRDLSAEIREAFEHTILPAVQGNRKNYLYFTLWTIIDKHEGIMVGDLCFKGLPDKNGEVEIGYGIYPDCQNSGYMTEAIRALMQWAFRQKNIKAVVAETLKTNQPSMKVLEKNGFLPYKEVKGKIWWRLKSA